MKLRYVVYGAGGVGGVIGALLFQAGFDVTLIARGEHARVMRTEGLKFIAPGEQSVLNIPVVEHPRDADIDCRSMVLLCMKSQHTLAALEDLSSCAAEDTRVACVQNGVANESLALRYFKHTYATVVNLPALFLNPGEVVSYAQGGSGILDSGCFPLGEDETVRQYTADLTDAGFSAQPDQHVMRQKYAKLLLNLNNILQAALQDYDNGDELRRQIRAEALACYAAAGIDCASREEVQDRQKGVYRMAPVPGFERTAGSSWQSLKRGTGDIETDYLNGEISWLGRLHGISTPANDACVALARELIRSGAGPGSVTAAELLAKL
jgi:2-dehydropantoate 2-reductase